MTADIRILAQFRENYGTETSPRWKMKGGVEFLISGVLDSVMYYRKEEVDEAISNMLARRSNKMASYELISWELLFSVPTPLSADEFTKEIESINIL